MYRLAKEFGWTPQTIRKQRAEDIDNLITIMCEIEKLQNIVQKHGPDSTTIFVED